MDNATTDFKSSTYNSNRIGFYSAVSITVITIITFSIAMTAVPVSGAFCPGNCITYPYMDTAAQYPEDFLWMYSAILLILIYMVLMVSIHSYAENQKKIFSQIGLSFALITTAILLCDYFIQVSVVPVSLINGETEGLPLLIQYNSHGLFLVLEELGYLTMAVSFIFMAPVFAGKGRLESAVQWIFIISFILVFAALIIISVFYGLERMDRFEVVVITVDWLVLIIIGILLSLIFRKNIHQD